MQAHGFGNIHQTEALEGALPRRQNNPQRCPYGLYAEQLSGSAFTRPRQQNLHSWLYRILPSVLQGSYRPYPAAIQSPFAKLQAPNPWRFSPQAALTQPKDWLEGLEHLAGSPFLQLYRYQCNRSMQRRYVSSADGELLFIPYQGSLQLQTEMGSLVIKPGMIGLIPRGVRFRVDCLEPCAAGYLCENGADPLNLPELGTIGANGLANPRHFLYPQAAFETEVGSVELVCKYQHQWWQTEAADSPLNVVAWQGNYAPYSYDLSLFNTINSVSFDHPDPSIFTVLSAASAIPGLAILDFVIFPARWMVAEQSFRPPYFHRNIMNECMGLIEGEYDAKAEGFEPGGFSIHNAMVPHGPDTQSFIKASQQPLKPERYENSLAFMLEARDPWLLTELALASPCLQTDYQQCWQDLPRLFTA